MNRTMQRSWMQLFLSGSMVLGLATSCRTSTKSALKDGPAEDVDTQMVQMLDSGCATAGCHQSQQGKLPNRMIRKFARQTQEVQSCLKEVTDPKDAWDYCLRMGDEFNHHIGIYKAAVKDESMKKIFEAAQKVETFVEFGDQMMPPGNEQNVFGDAATFEKLVTWMAKQPPQFDGLNRVRPPEPLEGGVCVEKISPELTAHVQYMQAANAPTWVNRYKSAAPPMKFYGCPGNGFPADPLTCLSSAPLKNDWRNAANGVNFNIRTLREINPYTSFWTRSSPDGRFVGNGGYSPPGGARDRTIARRRAAGDISASSSIEDLQVSKRVIGVTESYDPAFSPDNNSFVYVDKVCPLKPLRAYPSTLTGVDMNKPPCFSAEGVATYQSVGQRVGAGDEFWMVNPSNYSSDDGGSYVDENGSSGDEDAMQFGNASLETRLFKKDATGKFVPTLKTQKTPGESQHIISPSAMVVSGRFGPRDSAGGGLNLDGAAPVIGGYNVRFIEKMFADGDAYNADTDATRSQICIRGNKASMSYDDRFLITHHYTDEKDDPALAKKTSDLIIYDFLKQRSIKITSMPAGWFALYPHFRGDGWIYFLVRHRLYNAGTGTDESKDYIMATDAALQWAKMP